MTRATRALVTNDDGIDSPGLAALAEAASEAGLDVLIAAPEHQFSGASASITAVQEDGRTVVREVEGPSGLPAYAVRAAPAHIVVAGLQGWFDPAPDLVLSGINRGGNVGRAVLHSGTVGAALTAGLHDRRGLAVSLDVALGAEEEEHWDAVTGYLPRVLELLLDSPLGTTLSLNVPDRPAEEHRELRLAPLDPRGVVQTLVEEADGQGLLLREAETGERAEQGSDRALLAAGHPTLTALRGLCEDPDLLVPERLAHSARLTDERTTA
jgi:5'-nucleotidase